MQRKFPLSLKDHEEASVVKRDTLEYFAYSHGWHTPQELEEDPLLAGPQSPNKSRAIQMRLLRYSRQGLLSRRRAPRGYEYEITMKGEDRLFYLWDMFGDSNANRELTPEETERMTKVLNLKLSILDARKRALSDSRYQSFA
jgi:hypothetical protein